MNSALNIAYIPIYLNRMNIALVSYKKDKKNSQGATLDEDQELLNYLRDQDISIQEVIWNDENMNWSQFDLLIIKSPWDYHNYHSKFLNWLEEIHSLGIKVLNSVELIKWNSNKKYLEEIKAQGLPVISSVYLLKGSNFKKELFDTFHTAKLVVKPCISAGAQHTFLLHKEDSQDYIPQINQLLELEDFIVQPFIEEIKDGEWSFLFFNGKYSHCVLKTPKKDDFRVQQSHGGFESYPEANREYIEQASRFFKYSSGSSVVCSSRWCYYPKYI